MTEDLHEHEIDGLFRRGLEGAEDSPSPGLWSAIEKGLDPARPDAPQPAPGTGGNWMHPLLLKGMAGIAILATVGTISYYLGRDSQRRKEQNSALTETKSPTKQSSNPATMSDSKSAHTHHNAAEVPTADAGEAQLQTKPDEKSTRIESTTDGKSESKETIRQTDERRVTAVTASRSRENHPRMPASRLSSDKDPDDQVVLSGNPVAYPTAKEFVHDVSKPGGKAEAPPTSGGREATVANATRSALTDMERKGFQPPVFHLASPSGRHWSLVAPDPTSLRISTPVVTHKETTTKTANARPVIRREQTFRISFMPFVSVNTTQKSIKEDERYGTRNGREHREMAETESYGTTVSPGLYAAFDITPKLSIQSGFSELRNEISISPKEIRAVKDRDDKVRYRLDCSAGSFFIDPKTGTTPGIGDSIRLKGSDVRTRYATIPVHLLYRVGSGRVRGFAMAGADVNILVNRNATTTFQNASGLTFGTVRAEGLKPTTVNAVVGAGVELGLGRRMAITVMPQYRVALNSPNVDAPVKTYPKTLSLTAGLRVSF